MTRRPLSRESQIKQFVEEVWREKDYYFFDKKTLHALCRSHWPCYPKRPGIDDPAAAKMIAAAVWRAVQRPQPAVTLEEIEEIIHIGLKSVDVERPLYRWATLDEMERERRRRRDLIMQDQQPKLELEE